MAANCNINKPMPPKPATYADAEWLSKPVKVLLVDDQPIIAEAVRRMLEGEGDIAFHYCQNPLDALSAAASLKPTVILQDLVMPEVDGLTLVKYFRANPATRDMPLVVLSSKEEASTKYRAFENGANDYMVKLPDKLEVLARIRYHSKAYINLRERNAALAELQKSQETLRQELDQAEQYVESLLPRKFDTPAIKADWLFKSSTALGGDCFGYGWIDGGHFAMYLLDVCGHGVGAALLSVSAMNVMRSRSLPGVDFTKPAQVLFALNNAFDMDKQNNMYFTLWYGVYSVDGRELAYASGGHPPAILVGGGEALELSTGGMIIGGLPGMGFAEKTAKVPEGARLYIFSDGVYEIESAATHKMGTFGDFKARLLSPAAEGKTKLESMFAAASALQGSDRFADDYSMCEIIFR